MATTISSIIFDLDGVFTDGKIYIMDDSHFKCYNGKDTYGLKLLRNNNIRTGLITAHNTPILENMEHIVSRMDYISKGHYNKLDIVQKWIDKEKLDWSNVAYIGDDIPDIAVVGPTSWV